MISGLLITSCTAPDSASLVSPTASSAARLAPSPRVPARIGPGRPATPASRPSVTPEPAAMSEDFLYLTSDLGDPVGEGVIRSLDYSNARFLVASDTSRSRATLQVRSAGEDWTVTLMAPLGQELDVGSYDSAQRSPDNLTAGIDVRGNGRACVETFGTFTISAITFEPDGHLQILEAEFDQNCELPDAPALHGTLIYRAPPPGG